MISKKQGGDALKKKMLIVGITMSAGGSEKSFLSFAEHIDYKKWDVTLLLAEKKGAFLPLLPSQIKVETMADGEIMEISAANAKKILLEKYVAKNPLRAFPLAFYATRTALANGDKKVYAKNRLWLAAMKTLESHPGEYDLAIAYWGDRTMFYMVDKVCAKKKTPGSILIIVTRPARTRFMRNTL